MGNPYNGFSWQERMARWPQYKADVAAGKRQWPKVCDACGQDQGRIEPHDEDYAAELCCEFGVCYRCHMLIHCRFRNPEAWDAYRDAVRAGKRAEPLFGRNAGWPAVCKQLNGQPPRYVQHAPPKRLLLDEIESGRWLNRGKPGTPPARKPKPPPKPELPTLF